ncbi:hypothetical protein E1301_Tti017629 [Triplophysa tibetana]|uniref:Uncharacterized protein n=1 Tax=Triplophysa tibetana TaxID=1572043 RepID=A0A5A9NGP4_9TELE|nr:hypothetical protein E1301_Tti017629 [Triplophysa tibetana]
MALSALLLILKFYHPTLPKDGRMLLKTKNIYNIKSVAGEIENSSSSTDVEEATKKLDKEHMDGPVPECFSLQICQFKVLAIDDIIVKPNERDSCIKIDKKFIVVQNIVEDKGIVYIVGNDNKQVEVFFKYPIDSNEGIYVVSKLSTNITCFKIEKKLQNAQHFKVCNKLQIIKCVNRRRNIIFPGEDYDDDEMECTLNETQLKKSSPYLHPSVHSSSDLNPSAHSSPDFHPSGHSSPDLHPSAHSSPNVHPNAHSSPYLYPSAYSSPDHHPSAHTCPNLHPSGHGSSGFQPNGNGSFEPNRNEHYSTNKIRTPTHTNARSIHRGTSGLRSVHRGTAALRSVHRGTPELRSVHLVRSGTAPSVLPSRHLESHQTREQTSSPTCEYLYSCYSYVGTNSLSISNKV